jgi:hypothetical protein
MASTAYSFDLFLSYNSEDHDVVEDIARKLRDEGLEPFLDRWYLAPGTRWRSKLEDTLSSCKAVAIFVGPGEMGSWQQREVDVALDLQSRNSNLPVIPVLLPGCEPPLGFLRQLTWVDLRSHVLDRGIAVLIKAARGEERGPDLQRHIDSVRASICPYRGLLYFREEDAPFFFGREAAIKGLVEGIKHHSFFALVGASGSGKSSVVRAGLVPRLRNDDSTTWEFISIVPTDQPLKALATALVPFLEPTKSEVERLEEAGKLARLFAAGTVSLYDVVRRILDKQRGTDRVLIFVDQFEELYTLVQDDAGRRKFVDELITASTVSGSKLKVAITLRGDFVGKAFAYRALSDRLQGAQINLGPMTRQELTSVIRKPAEKLQLNFEAGLVERILDAVGDEPGNLPLLEFVLRELWEKRRGGLLLNESYDTMGELKGALAKKADNFLVDLSPAEQNILQRVFLRLVSPADGGENTRRRSALMELPLQAVDLVDKLTKERLLVTNISSTGAAQTVEVAHEALISNWDTLRAWVNEDREFLFWRKRLEGLLHEWERVGKDESALLRGPLLIEGQSWFDKRSQDLSEEEHSFINASRALRDRLEGEEKKRQEQELEDAEKRAKEQKEAASKLRRLAWMLALVALSAGAAAIFGFQQRNEAINRKHEAELANAEKEKQRQEAVAAENDAQNQAKIADERLQAAQLALTDSFFRTIGVSTRGIPTRDEREALWELAQLDGANAAVREKLLNRWFETAEAFMRGQARVGQGFRAATGLNVEYHQFVTSKAAELGRRLAAALENPKETNSGRLWSPGEALAALAKKIEPQAAAEIAKGLATALENPQETNSNRLWSLGNALAALANKMEPQAAAEIAKRGAQPLAAALENPQESDPNRLSGLGNALAALADKMEPQAAAEIAKGLAAALENPQETNSNRLSRLSNALAALANKMEPQAAAEIAKRGAQRLAAAWENPQETNSDRLSGLGNALAALADKMEPQAAAEIAKGLATALENPQETNSERLSRLGNALAALANKMDPQAAAEIAKQGAQRLAAALENPQESDPNRLSGLGNALAALANKMDPQAAAEIAKGLATALENPQETNSNRLWSLGEALAALANKMEPQAAAQIAKGLAAALENQQETDSNRLSSLGQSLGALCRLLPSTHRTHLVALSNMLLRPLSEKLPESKEQPRDWMLFAEVCAQLSQQDLSELLKYPFCTGEAEQIVLKELNSQTHRDFGEDVWKFVEQADSLGIKDVDSPAKRPSVQDALKELNAL